MLAMYISCSLCSFFPVGYAKFPNVNAVPGGIRTTSVLKFNNYPDPPFQNRLCAPDLSNQYKYSAPLHV